MSQVERRSFSESRRRGWGIGLYRSRSDSWIGGICAGLAAHWDLPNWVVRLTALALLMFTGTLVFLVYVLAWIVIAPATSRWSESPGKGFEIDMEQDENHQYYRRKKASRYGYAPAERLRKAQDRMSAATDRIEAIEYYVTSKEYEINREFSKL